MLLPLLVAIRDPALSQEANQHPTDSDALYRRATEEVRQYREEGWTVLPVAQLGTYLLWYRATAAVLDRLPADPVEGDERAELVAATHDAAVERFERAVDAADGDLLARSYLRYASSYLRRGNEVVERYATNDVERSDDRHALVEACTSFLRAYGVAESPMVTRSVRSFTE